MILLNLTLHFLWMFFLAKQFLRRRFKKKRIPNYFPLKLSLIHIRIFCGFAEVKNMRKLETDREINSQPSSKNVIRIFSLGEPKGQQFTLFAEMLILMPEQ